MNREEVIEQRAACREEKNAIMKAVMKRFDEEMKDKSIQERQEVLLYSTPYTDEEKEQVNELDWKIRGLTHMLSEGFFKPKRAPRSKKDDDLLY